jgi:NAD(P)-dependent dehydrogenase (short-subunit alcohol dehydrogenase family)
MTTKIALITGGNRGLGKNSALRLAQKGNDIIITFNTNQKEANAVVAEIEALGRKAAALKLDLGNLKSFDEFISQVSQTLKEKFQTDKFDFLINNAGFGATIPFAQATEEDFDKFMNVHFKGVYFLTQKILSIMNDNGSIVNFSSGTTRFVNPGYSMYASMKGAVEIFSKYLAKEVGSRGINVNILAPGAIETDFNNAAIRNNPQIKAMLAGNTALGRVGQADDIGGVVAMLCSDDAKWINGQRIEASGGINL